MTTQNEEPREKKRSAKRQRSTNYPSMDLSWASDIIKKAHSSGTTNRTALAQLFGHRDDTSGPARSKLAALRHFSLVEYDEGNVKIATLGEKIAAPMPNEDVSEALRQSFFSVASFKQAYDLCAKGVTLPKDTLENISTRQVGITARAAQEFVDIFVQSGIKAGLIEKIDDKSIKILKAPVAAKERVEQKGDQESPQPPPPPPHVSSMGLQSLTINLQITLPETTNSTVYEAIFKAMKEYLLVSGE